MSSLNILLGVTDRLGNKSLPQFLNDMRRDRRTAAIVEEARAQQALDDEVNRRQMLMKIRALEMQIDDLPPGPQRSRRADKLAESEILLTERAND